MSLGLDSFHSQCVYRVLRPDEDFNNHLFCCDIKSNRTIDQHIADGLKIPSHFISTTSSLANAVKWLNTSNRKCFLRYFNIRSVIVRIDISIIKTKYPIIASTAYDLSSVVNRNHFLKTEIQKKYSAAYSEVVFNSIIPKEAVFVEFIVGMGNIGSPSVRNDTSILYETMSEILGEENTEFLEIFKQKEKEHGSPITSQTSSRLPIQQALGHSPPIDQVPPLNTYLPNQKEYIETLLKLLGRPPS
ncbi:hypothetical protein LOD99_9080 [Oopsacas minuta]|uniref:DUF7587 domain-containing protein n=1 Tax=Oopsacas minuta TaxID=111878 RepID=A0AAV7JDL4_9METZ|nr:hypothetical protein LOD99_9080 [Oopsacas minuta]